MYKVVDREGKEVFRSPIADEAISVRDHLNEDYKREIEFIDGMFITVLRELIRKWDPYEWYAVPARLGRGTSVLTKDGYVIATCVRERQATEIIRTARNLISHKD